MSAGKVAPSAQKGLIRTVRCLAKGTSIWIQGVVVWVSETQLAIDDGSGIARAALQEYMRHDSSPPFREGQYVMVVGIMLKRFKGHRMGMKATTICDLTSSPMLETMWNLEVADAFLYGKEKGASAVMRG